jgi:Tfp pilus assembly PilM family ATPase
MAKWLAIDVEQGRWRLAEANVGRGTLSVERLEEWVPPEDPIRTNAESLGAKLKDFLREKNLAAQSVVLTFGREKVFLKELRYPVLPPADEAGLVRFQATKDLPDSSDPPVVDYVALNEAKAAERETLAVSTRRGWLQSILGICKGAGLKVAGATPRFYGLVGLADFAGMSSDSVAFVAPSELTSELTVLQRSKPVFARALASASSPGLAAEVQRSLAVFRIQRPEQGAVSRILLLAETGDLAGQLAGPIPVEPFAAKIDSPRPLHPNEYAALGAAYLCQRDGKLPINLAAPRDPKPGVDPNRRRKMIIGVGSALLILFAIVGLMMTTSRRNAQIAQLESDLEDVKENIKLLEQERTDNAFFKEWEDTTVAWVDEIHNIAAKLPHTKGFRLTQVVMAPAGKRVAKDAPKDPVIAKMTLHGVMKTEQDVLVSRFQEALNQDGHLRASLERFKGSASGAVQDFHLKVDVGKPTAAPLPKTPKTPMPAPLAKGVTK